MRFQNAWTIIVISLFSYFLSQVLGELNNPNIIFILMDDIGLADMNYSSSVGDIPTPNIDFIAKSGIILENYYVNSLCTPTRAAVLTGRYSINTGLTSVLVPGMNASSINAKR